MEASGDDDDDEEVWANAGDVLELLDECGGDGCAKQLDATAISEFAAASHASVPHVIAGQRSPLETPLETALQEDGGTEGNPGPAARGCGYGFRLLGSPGLYAIQLCAVRRLPEVSGAAGTSAGTSGGPITMVEGGQTCQLSVAELEERCDFEIESRLTFSDPFLMRNYSLWALPGEALQERREGIGAALLAQWKDNVAAGVTARVYLEALEGAGLGLHAAEELPPLHYVGEYTGLLKVDGPSEDGDSSDGYRLCYPATPGEHGGVCLTAMHRGSLMRFINHSSKKANGRWVHIDGADGIYHVVFVTCRLIEKGEQLLVDYGPQYWRNRAVPLDL